MMLLILVLKYLLYLKMKIKNVIEIIEIILAWRGVIANLNF